MSLKNNLTACMDPGSIIEALKGIVEVFAIMPLQQNNCFGKIPGENKYWD
jgi:hypothetical protein